MKELCIVNFAIFLISNIQYSNKASGGNETKSCIHFSKGGMSLQESYPWGIQNQYGYKICSYQFIC